MNGPRGLLATNLLDHSGEMLHIPDDEHAMTPFDQPGPCQIIELTCYRFAVGAHAASNFRMGWNG